MSAFEDLPITRRDVLRAGAAVVGASAATLLTGCPKTGQPPPPGLVHAAAAPALFTDLSHEAGVSFVQSHGGCGMRYFVEQVTPGAAVLDANGDGHMDIYFPQPKPLGVCKFKYPLKHRLYLNDGKGNFKLSANAFGGVETDYGISAAVGDYNNDGHPDIFVACYGKSTLFRNRGDGTFEDVTAASGIHVTGFATGAVWFDYDNDGFLDLYVGRYCDWTLAKDIPCPGPNGARDVCEPKTYTPSTNFLFHNNGDGTFTDVTAKSGAAPATRRSLGIAAFDFDQDGWLDLFVANDLGPNYLLKNNHDGTFQDVAMQIGVASGLNGNYQANMGAAVGDYNNSGRLSVCVSTFAGEPRTLYRNDNAFFTDVSAEAGIDAPTRAYLAFGAGFFDSRNLGRLDLFFANGHVSPFTKVAGRKPFKQQNQLLLNDGTGNFTESSSSLPAADSKVHRAACFADFDGDGRIDVLVTAQDDTPTLLMNRSPQANWLLVKLINSQGCVTPIGARCTATIGPEKLFRVVLGGGSYGGESDHRVHFGLKTATRVDSLEIKWMSGKVQVVTNISANQVLTIREEA